MPATLLNRNITPIALAFAAVLAVLTPMLLGPAAETARAQDGTSSSAWSLDKAHTSVYFRIGHLGMSYTYGRFNEFDGSFATGANPRFSFVVQASSVDTGNEKRDAHIRNPDFFNARQYPVIRLESTSVTPTDEGYEVTADVSLHGVTRSETFVLREMGQGEDPWGNTRIGFATEFTIKRSDYGMNKMMQAVGDEVDLMISFEGIK